MLQLLLDGPHGGLSIRVPAKDVAVNRGAVSGRFARALPGLRTTEQRNVSPTSLARPQSVLGQFLSFAAQVSVAAFSGNLAAPVSRAPSQCETGGFACAWQLAPSRWNYSANA